MTKPVLAGSEATQLLSLLNLDLSYIFHGVSAFFTLLSLYTHYPRISAPFPTSLVAFHSWTLNQI